MSLLLGLDRCILNRWTDALVPSELYEPAGTIGESYGWVATFKDRILCLQDDLNPNASASNPKRIPLPRLVTLPHCQTDLVTNVSMSSSSPEDDDCVVAVKFLGPQLSLCRPAYGSGWTNITITDPSFFSSRVMFSKRDQTFSLLAYGGHEIGSWDLHKHINNPKLQKLHFQNFPVCTKTIAELIGSPYMTEHLVESPAGETLLVKWFKYRIKDIIHVQTKSLMVFKLDDEGNAVFTDDIGDANIFISNGEPFSLPSSSYPGLEPNDVYFVDEHEVGVMDVANMTNTSNVSTDLSFPVAYFIPSRF
ncbi:unnamed protein product [Arabidopsis halleri]